jgi:uroporphyrinogen-III synthase
LERRGATVVYGPVSQIVPVEDDEALPQVTQACLVQPPGVVVATGIAFRGWVVAADGWGLGEDLLACVGLATLLARGPNRDRSPIADRARFSLLHLGTGA